MESLTIFVRTTRALFDILITEFGATVIEPADPRNKIVTSVQYDLGPLRVEIWNDRGGCSLELVVKEDTPIIRPYMSHYFNLYEVIRYLDPSFQPTPDTPAPTPGKIDWNPAPVKSAPQLQVLQALLLQYCRPILQGDIEPLEELTIVRYDRKR